MTRSVLALTAEALALGEAALPALSSKHSRRDGYTLPQLFAVQAVRKFLRLDYRSMEIRLVEWAELREAIGLSKVPDHSMLCLAEGKLSKKGLSTDSWRHASTGRGDAASSTRGPRRRSTPRGWRRGTRRCTSVAARPETLTQGGVAQAHRGGSHDESSDLDDLVGAIDEYINAHNENPKPFIWTASTSDILAKVKRARQAANKL